MARRGLVEIRLFGTPAAVEAAKEALGELDLELCSTVHVAGVNVVAYGTLLVDLPDQGDYELSGEP